MNSDISNHPGLSLVTILERISSIALHIQQGWDWEDMLQQAIADARTLLETDRILIYRLLESEDGVTAFESVGAGWTSTMGQLIYDPCLKKTWVERYRQGQTTTISDVHGGQLPACHVELLDRFQVQANLVVPILNRDCLWGLLIAHHCRSPRQWQPIEVQYLQHLALHLGVAIQQSDRCDAPQRQMERSDRPSPTARSSPDRENGPAIALKAAEAGMWQWDIATNRAIWSEENYRMLGYDPQQHNTTYETWLNAVHPEDRQAAHREVTQALAEKRDLKLEYRVLLPGNRVRWLVDIGKITYAMDGNPAGMIGIKLDITERKCSELALQELNRELELTVQQQTADLQESAVLWQFALEGAGDGVWDWNARTNRVFFSRQWKAMLGYADDEIGDTLEEWDSRVHPEDKERCYAALADHFNGHTSTYQCEHRVRCKDGRYKWILDRGKVIEWSADGKPLRVIGTHADITECKQAEEQLKNLSDRLNLAVQSAGIGIWDWDMVNDRLIWDDRMYNLYGIQPSGSDADYAFWAASIHPEDLPGCCQLTQEALADQGSVATEFRIILPDGTIRHIESHALVQRASDGSPLRMIGLNFDISDRKAVETALREQQQFTEQIASSTLAILYVYDLQEQRNIYVSEQVEMVLGYSPEDIQAMGNSLFSRLIHPDDLAGVLEIQRGFAHIQDHEFLEAEYRMRHKNGSYRWLLSRVRVLNRTPEGIPKQTIGVAMDISTLKEIQATLQQQTDRERLLISIAQNIRQTLDLEQILHTAVTEVRQLLQVNRVVIYRFEPGWSGIVVAESVEAEWNSILGRTITDTYFIETQGRAYLQGRTTAIDDVYTANLAACHLEMMEQLQVRAKLVVPILQNNHLWGLLVAHQCQGSRSWDLAEINLLQQIATQMAIAIQQSELYQQVQILNTELELQVQERTAELQQALSFEELLKRITDKVRDSLDEQQILQTVVEELACGLPIDACVTGIYDAEQTTSTIAYEVTNTLPAVQGHSVAIANAPHAEIYPFLLQGQVCQFCDIAPNPLRAEQRLLSILACPILDENGALGDIWLFKPSHDIFNAMEIRLVEQVANQCAIALRQSRLYQAAQAQVQELKRLNQLKDDFLSTVSHELRTPMSNIKMATQMLEISLNRLGVLADESNSVYRYFKILREEGQREINLINDLLDLTRLDAEAELPQFVEINLQAYMPRWVESFVERMRQQQQYFVLQIAEDLPPFKTHLIYLERILAELLQNACKYTPTGETISLSARSTSTAIEVRISNSGVEISPEECERIFDRFYRIPNNDPWKYGGTGLGLALVKKLVKRLGGHIAVESGERQVTFVLELAIDLGLLSTPASLK